MIHKNVSQYDDFFFEKQSHEIHEMIEMKYINFS